MVHPSRQALADEQEHALMDTSSRDTFILQDWPVGIITHQSPYKITCGKGFRVATCNKLAGAVAFLQIRHLLTYFSTGAEIKDPLCC